MLFSFLEIFIVLFLVYICHWKNVDAEGVNILLMFFFSYSIYN